MIYVSKKSWAVIESMKCICGYPLNINTVVVVYPYFDIARFSCPECNLIIGSIRFDVPKDGTKNVGFRPLSI